MELMVPVLAIIGGAVLGFVIIGAVLLAVSYIYVHWIDGRVEVLFRQKPNRPLSLAQYAHRFHFPLPRPFWLSYRFSDGRRMFVMCGVAQPGEDFSDG